MTLYMIGLGIGDITDLTLKGVEAIKKCSKVYLESYTGVYGSNEIDFSNFFKKEVIVATRDLVEKKADSILESAKENDVAFLVVGDVFGATTHTDLFLRAKEKNIDVQIIHNASIINSVSDCGLDLYKFGAVTSIVFDDDNWLPENSYDIIKDNFSRGLHTLCLLDIKVAEPSKENLLKGINKAEMPRFMTVNHAISILKKIELIRKEKIISDEMLVVGIARLGHPDEIIKAGTLKEISEFDFGKEVHCLIVPGKLNELEKQMIDLKK